MNPDLERRIIELEKWKNYQDSPARSTFTKDIHIRNNRRIIGSIYGGEVSDGGAATALPVGWTSERNAEGNYTVTHNLGTTDYVVVVTPYDTGSARRYLVTVVDRSANSFKYDIVKETDGLDEDLPAFFILMLV